MAAVEAVIWGYRMQKAVPWRIVGLKPLLLMGLMLDLEPYFRIQSISSFSHACLRTLMSLSGSHFVKLLGCEN